MKLEYVLEEQDFINFHLFAISENKNSVKIKNAGKPIIITFFLYYGIKMYNMNNTEFALILGIMIILVLFFYDKLYKLKIKKHFSKIVRNSYTKRIGETETMEFTTEYLITEDKTGIGKTKLSEIEKINETKNNFFVKLSNGASFIVSKNGIENIDLLKNKWVELNIPISENLSWQWK